MIELFLTHTKKVLSQGSPQAGKITRLSTAAQTAALDPTVICFLSSVKVGLNTLVLTLRYSDSFKSAGTACRIRHSQLRKYNSLDYKRLSLNEMSLFQPLSNMQTVSAQIGWSFPYPTNLRGFSCYTQ